MRIRRVVVVLALGLMGCGGGDGGGGGGDGGSGVTPTPASFPGQFAEAWCGLLSRCCLASGGTDKVGCQAGTGNRVSGIATQASADGAAWNGAVAARCLQLLATADCAAIDPIQQRDLLDVCNDTWDGVIPPGGTCQTYVSCAEPAVSGGAVAAASCVNMKCVVAVAQPPGAACPTGVSCDRYRASCQAQTCVALPGPGQQCTGDCLLGARCMTGMCVALQTTGQTCSSDGQCVSDKCRGGRCSSPFVADGEYCQLP